MILETELPQAQDGSVRLLQITDTHLFASAEGRLLAVRTAESLAAVLEQVQANEHPYEVILATGDLSQRMLLPSLCALDADGLLDEQTGMAPEAALEFGRKAGMKSTEAGVRVVLDALPADAKPGGK